jgi:hypothetical protein
MIAFSIAPMMLRSYGEMIRSRGSGVLIDASWFSGVWVP